MERRSGFESSERARVDGCVADSHPFIEPVRTLRPPIILVGMHPLALVDEEFFLTFIHDSIYLYH